MRTDLTILQGETFSRTFRWGMSPIIYKPITAITNEAPVAIQCIAHGLVDGWVAAVVSVQGMTEINAQYNPPRARDYKKIAVVDVDNIIINAINASEFELYTSGGYLQYFPPVDLTGYSARMSIKDGIGGTEILRLDTNTGGIVLDNVAKTIVTTISATDAAALTDLTGVYDLELESAAGVVKRLRWGSIVLSEEVTT